MTRAPRALAAALVALTLLGGSLAAGHAEHEASTAGVVRPDAISVPRFSKVAVLFLENHGYRQVIDSRQAPFLNRLARHGALATRYYAVAHPSLPNYLAITTGSTRGLSKDSNSYETSAPSLAGQLEAAGIPWKAYFEGIPSPGFDGSGFLDYTKHYNPFAYSEKIGEGVVARRHVVGFGALRRDLRRRMLPRFSWIAPDLLHDGHNASVRASDQFASRLVPRVVKALGPHGVLIVTWDEAQGVKGPRGGRVALIASGPGARHRVRVSTAADHYSLLATLEAGLRLPALGHAAARSTPLLTGLLARR